MKSNHAPRRRAGSSAGNAALRSGDVPNERQRRPACLKSGPAHRGDVLIVGAVCAGSRLDGVIDIYMPDMKYGESAAKGS